MKRSTGVAITQFVLVVLAGAMAWLIYDDARLGLWPRVIAYSAFCVLSALGRIAYLLGELIEQQQA
jgi:hypothetical protein